MNGYREPKRKRPADEFAYRGFALVNHDKSLFVDYQRYMIRSALLRFPFRRDDEFIDPLPILTVAGNGHSRSDYNSPECQSQVGSWAGDLLSIVPLSEVPRGFGELQVSFGHR